MIEVTITAVSRDVDGTVTDEKYPGVSVAVENDGLAPKTAVLTVDTPKLSDRNYSG